MKEIQLPEDKKGIKELSELMQGLMEISLLLSETLKDGFQASDFIHIMNKLKSDKEFQIKMEAAYDKMSEVPAEAKDLDAVEISQLLITLIPYIPKFISVFTKDK